jgi:hypothetical protein
MARRSPVHELQELATDPTVDITALLRKALLVATKLGLKGFREWIDRELNGYSGKEEVPPYRRLHAKVWLKNPYHGLVPVMFANSRVAKAFCQIEVGDPIGGLKHILDNQQPGASSPIFPLTPQQTALLLEQQDGLGLPPVRTVSENQIASVLDSVRTAILEWALKLEQEGILGEGISFTQEEVIRATTSTQIRIGNFQGILGNIQGSTVSQTMCMDVRKGDWPSLEKYLQSIGVSVDDVAELSAALEAEAAPGERRGVGKRVSDWMGRMVSKAASGVWQVGVGAAGDLLASAIKAYYGWV